MLQFLVQISNLLPILIRATLSLVTWQDYIIVFRPYFLIIYHTALVIYPASLMFDPILLVIATIYLPWLCFIH